MENNFLASKAFGNHMKKVHIHVNSIFGTLLNVDKTFRQMHPWGIMWILCMLNTWFDVLVYNLSSLGLTGTPVKNHIFTWKTNGLKYTLWCHRPPDELFQIFIILSYRGVSFLFPFYASIRYKVFSKYIHFISSNFNSRLQVLGIRYFWSI